MDLLITGAWKQASTYIPEIEKQHKVKFVQYENEELPCDPEWVEGIIGNGVFLFHPIEKFKNLKYIQLTSAGFDRVPMEYVRERSIKINNARGVYSIPMAEYVLSNILAFYKRYNYFSSNQRNHLWIKNRHIKELYGQKVCILGCGSVGAECAKRFVAMGCNVIGVASSEREQTHFSHVYCTRGLALLLPQADIIIVTLPLTEQTKYIINADHLKTMKDNAVLVNIARGALVDTVALTEELRTGRISAILDVFEEEPLSEKSELWDMENVMISPHNSFEGDGNGKRMSDVIMNYLDEYSGRSLKE